MTTEKQQQLEQIQRDYDKACEDCELATKKMLNARTTKSMCRWSNRRNKAEHLKGILWENLMKTAGLRFIY